MVNVDASDVNLHGADIHDSWLTGVNLQNADLSEANLQGLDCSPNMTLLRVGCNFSHADFSNADMRGTNMNFMVLENADLEDGIFDETTILRDGTNNATNWIPETDWGRFTDPQYSDFEGLTCSVEGWAFGRFGCPPINLKGAWN